MTATLLKDFKSKRACPQCAQNKLFTNDSEKADSIVHYHCLNCGNQFFETEGQREAYKQKAEEKKKNDPSKSVGFTLIGLVFATILALFLSQGGESQRSPESEPSGQTEQLNRAS